jgi:hypothetical protein
MCVCGYLQFHAGNTHTHTEDGIPVPSGMNRFWHPSHTSTRWQPCPKLGGVFQSLQRCGSSIHEEYLGLRWRCCQLRSLLTWRHAFLCSTHHSCNHSSFKWKSFVQASRISVEWQALTAADRPHFQARCQQLAECYGLFQTPHRVSQAAGQTTKKSKRLR